MNAPIETLNRCGENALHFAWPMLWQSSVLIAVLFAFDFALRRHVRAAVRYALWLVLLVKLLLPPSLALPTGAAWWIFPPVTPPAKKQTAKFVVNYGPETIPNLPPQPTPIFVPHPQPSMSAAAWAISAWGAIGLGLFTWLTVRWQQVARVVRRATPAPDWLGELFDEAKSSTGLRLAVRLRLTDQSMSPAVCGLFRPVILLPQSLAQKLPPAQLRAVLLHELTHLRRGDVWMNCAQALAQIVYWWHPLLWFANARIRRVREEAVDDAVMLALRDEAETYAPTLLEVAKLAFHRPLASLGLVGILESRSALRQRIEHLVSFHAPRKAGLTLVSLCGIFIFSAAALPMGGAPPLSSDTSKIASPVYNGMSNKPASSAGISINLHTRTFIVTANVGLPNLRKQTGLTESSTSDEYLRGFSKLLSSTGATLPPTSIWLKEQGILLVRSTLKDLDTIEQMVLGLNGFPTRKPQEGAQSGTIMNRATSTPAETGHSTNLETRTFNVDPYIFHLGLQSVGAQNFGPANSNVGDHASGRLRIVTITDQTADISQAAKQFFTKLGLNLDPPKSVFFNDRLSVLFVRATEQDLDTIEQAIQVLNMTPPQIHIKAWFIEVPEEIAKGLGTNFTPTDATNIVGILTDPDFRLAIDTLEQNKAANILAEPEFTTLSGRQTEMRATQVITIITNFCLVETATNTGIMPQQSSVECGPVLDVVPSLLADGHTIDLTLIPSLTEFLGYDTPPTNSIPVTTSKGEIVHVPTILPKFDIRQSLAHVQLRDNQTVVLGGMVSTQVHATKNKVPVLGSIPLAGRLFRSESRITTKNSLLVFVTATLIDPAGNRMYSDEKTPVYRVGIPAQNSP